MRARDDVGEGEARRLLPDAGTVGVIQLTLRLRIA
jgi:hypothetical protein